jgi:primosomal protein N' (replication factor Y)
MYAEVVVNAPLGRVGPRREVAILPEAEAAPDQASSAELQEVTFHYSVPPSLARQVAVGQLVQVPFGAQRRQGMILALTETAPVAETRELEAILEPEPVLTPLQIALARWISERYLCPLNDALRLMWPPGADRRPQTIVDLRDVSALPADASDEERRVVAHLRSRGSLPVERLAQELGWPDARPAVEHLARAGVVEKRIALTPPRVGPKIERTVRLIASLEQIAATLPRLGRPSRPADVLEALLASTDPLPTVKDICAKAGCSDAVIRALAGRGWMTLTEKRTLVWLRAAPETVEETLQGELKRSPAQAAALAYLRDQKQPVEIGKLRAHSGVLRALKEKGYVERRVEEPTILLRLPPQEVKRKILALRGLERHMEVLHFLAEEKEPVWIGWIYAQTNATLQTLKDLAAAGLVALEEAEVWRDPLVGQEFVQEAPPRLTPDQERAWQEIRRGLEEARSSSPPPIYLLHGVTGSGKTEIYLKAIQFVVEAGQGAIMLVPEISLTPQTIRRLVARFPGKVGVLHSRLSLGERYDTWRRIRAREIPVVLGSRSALFAPVPDLGLIILDEEHDSAYKQERTPRYHARQVALKLGQINGVPVILGSATPDLVSFYQAQRGRYRLLELPRRIMGHRHYLEAQRIQYNIPDTGHIRQFGAGYEDVRYLDLPPVQIVDMRAELRAGNRSIFSRALQQGMRETLEAGEQAILFMNRRGAATFVLCRDCGHVLRCRRCDVPLTYHAPAGEEATLVCHHCNRREGVPKVCPRCGSGHIRYFGLGTQSVEAAVQEMFPQANILRWDLDTTRHKGAHELFLKRFIEGEAQVLIGTQMIAKGLDLPLVTLVGVISADTALHFPDYHAAEWTFQLLTQVAGRAGRSPLGGQVILQTYNPEHYSIQAAAAHDYERFYREELAFRRQQGYPPFRRLARLVYLHSNARQCEAEARRMAEVLGHTVARLGLPGIELIGPAPCYLGRLRGYYRWQVLLRAPDPAPLLREVTFPLGWQVDVDPVSLL